MPEQAHFEDQSRRIKAAQALGGHGSAEALAAELKRQDSGIGLKRLRSLYRGTERARTPELREIAAACWVPLEFFTVELDRLPEIAGEPTPLDPAEVADRFAAIEARLAALEAEGLPPSE